MKVSFKLLILFVLAAFAFQSCDDMDDTLGVPKDIEVQNFIWKGLNLYYLWQDDVPDLADGRFANQAELNEFLQGYNDPVALFQHLRVEESLDRFSVIVSDYTVLENLFQGITKNNGMEFGLKYKPGSTTEIFGYVKYVIPNSDAASKGIQRGDLFYAVDGTQLTFDNRVELLSSDSYTIGMADFDSGNITPNGESITLTKTQLTENPVLFTDMIETGSHKVAYLMYNGFTANFDPQLNAAFGGFVAEGATDLVLDLRYNSGGSVQTATYLASMITGQFNGQLFAKQQWNSKVQSFLEENNPGQLVNNFTNSIGNAPINSLNLSKVYILTSASTASASELVINGLKPYIQVIQIGDVTTGKNVGSITLYDSPTFRKENVNPRHKYAMQPIVIKTINKDGFGDYQNGLQPTIPLLEDVANLSQLGNPDEPLLGTALGIITGSGRMQFKNPENFTKEVGNSKSLQPMGTEMYLNQVPSGLSNTAPFKF